MTQLPETAYAPFSEPWVLADVEQPDKQQADEDSAGEVTSVSKMQEINEQTAHGQGRPSKVEQSDEQPTREAIITSNVQEEPTCEFKFPSEVQATEEQPTFGPVNSKKPVHEEQPEAIIAALGPEVQKYWTQTKRVVFGPEVQKYWTRIRGAVYPFVGGIAGGVLTAGLTVYKIK